MFALRITVVLVAAGCGRVGFDGVAARTDDASVPDASACAAGDGVCLPACLASDPDCITTCGDGRCVGNAGELCGTTCMSDCATTAVVCGNAECQAGEDGFNCYADCGPPTWSWETEEVALRTAINAARTGGTSCPGGGGPQFAPALAVDTTMQPGAREYAWEIAHHDIHLNDACNGRTFAERQAPYGGNGGLSQSVAPTAADAVALWSSDVTLCPVLMLTGRTQLAVGVAIDAQPGWVMWMR
jgi:hypothetical protein